MVFVVAPLVLAIPAMGIPVVVDSFDYGTTVVSVTNNFQYGDTYDPSINNDLPGSDHTRYWVIATTGEGNSGSFDTGITPGSIVMTKTHFGRITLGYQFSPSTDLSGYSAVNVLGSGLSSDEGSHTFHSNFEITLTDGDGSAFGIFVPLTGALGNITMNFSDMILFEAGADSSLNLAQITTLDVSSLVQYPTSSFTYTLSEINLVPEPATLGLLVLGGLAVLRRQRRAVIAVVAAAILAVGGTAMADAFGTGANQFAIDFVPISNGTNPASAVPAGPDFAFAGVSHDFRMGKLEVTNDQWVKFKAGLGVPLTGSPASAYRNNPVLTVPNLPVSDVSWYEAAQFVNWLNTSSGHHAAYCFTGTQGTGDYTLRTWTATDAADGTNLYRHKEAFYYLPTEDEWLKAAYWNGAALQLYATKPGQTATQGDGTSGIGWNAHDTGSAIVPTGPWAVGSGSEELNGTFDMMGNVLEWTESPYSDTGFATDSLRALRGGSFASTVQDCIRMSSRYFHEPDTGALDLYYGIGFRVASVPEPATLVLLAAGGLALSRRK